MWNVRFYPRHSPVMRWAHTEQSLTRKHYGLAVGSYKGSRGEGDGGGGKVEDDCSKCQ